MTPPTDSTATDSPMKPPREWLSTMDITASAAATAHSVRITQPDSLRARKATASGTTSPRFMAMWFGSAYTPTHRARKPSTRSSPTMYQLMTPMDVTTEASTMAPHMTASLRPVVMTLTRVM